MKDWLKVHRGDAPLIVALPHTGTDLADVGDGFISHWLARHDADWWLDRLYAFAGDLGATIVQTKICRSVIDVNRDPSGASLYPGMATTELCPTTTFDGVPLYAGDGPDQNDVARRRAAWFDPYHDALTHEIARLRTLHGRIVVYDGHSIRSHVPRLFDGELPQFNIGTNGGIACAPALALMVEARCAASGLGHVLDGRFKGGWTTRRYGRPEEGIHALQMELAMRGYIDEPPRTGERNWPTPFSAARAAPLTAVLVDILKTCLVFAKS